MAQVDPSKLDKVIEDAGLGSRSAKKLRDANERPGENTSSRPRGHGSTAPDVVAIDII